MQLHIFPFLELHRHGGCFSQYLELRKRVFVDELGWNISHNGSAEMDQYDHPLSIYSVVTSGGRVVAGARATPCSASWCGWSYMINDAHVGLIDAIPDDLLTEYPRSSSMWECTRLAVDNLALTADLRTEALRLAVFGLCLSTEERGAEKLLSLSPSVFGRVLGRLGYSAQRLGKAYRGVEDGRSYSVFSMACDPEINRKHCEGLISPLSTNSSSRAAGRLSISDLIAADKVVQ